MEDQGRERKTGRTGKVRNYGGSKKYDGFERAVLDGPFPKHLFGLFLTFYLARQK